MQTPHSHENEALKLASANISAQCPMHEHAPAEAARLHSNNNGSKVSPSCSHTDCLRPPVSGESDTSHCPFAKDKDASPPKRAKYSKVHPYAIISLFDGVGSAMPAVIKAIGFAPSMLSVTQSSVKSLENNFTSEPMADGQRQSNTPPPSMLTMFGNYLRTNVVC